MLTVYGLKSCDTCRKARRWLDEHGLEHQFRDVRADGVTAEQIAGWIGAVGVDVLLNRRGTTWRSLGDADKAVAGDAEAAALIARYPALIKRPVFEDSDGILVGFGDPQKARLESLADG